MKIAKILGICFILICIMAMGLAGCKVSEKSTKKENKPITVYLWDTDLIKELSPYIHQQFPDEDIEFIAGNNDTDLYSYLQEHGELPDIITVRRFSGTDAKDLRPFLMDFTSYDVVSEYSSYSLQYYKNNDGEINWLPICGIPQTIIANKTLFDRYGVKMPQNYAEYVEACRTFHNNGIKPYALDLAEDWSSHEMIQAGGIGELTSLNGMVWRSEAESALGDIEFDDAMWEKIFAQTVNFLKDSYFTKADLNYDTDAAMKMFTEGKAAMFHGTSTHMQQCKAQMKDELIRLPYFSQKSNEGFIYMTPSLHVAFNKNLESDSKKLEIAMKVLNCMISSEGQKLIANGGSVISFNPSVPSIENDMAGLEDEMKNHSYYIRYSAQKSFAASFKAVVGLLIGSMNEKQAYDAFKSVMNSKDPEAETTVTFEKDYSLSLNNKNGRDAASSILTTVREKNGAQLALAPYYYFTSSIFKGPCTSNRINLMIANKPNSSSLYLEKLTGSQIKELVERYLTSTDGGFQPACKYELPIASGMKLVADDKAGIKLKEIMIDGNKIDEDKEYLVLLTDGMISVLEKMNTEHALNRLEGTSLSEAWTESMLGGQQPSEPEDYIEVQN